MFYNVLIDIFVVFLAQFFVSSNGPVTKLLLTEFALTSHDSILNLQETTFESKQMCFACIASLQADAIGTRKTGIKRAVGFVISRDLALSRPDVEHIEKALKLQCYRNLRTRNFLVNLIFI